MKKRDLKKIIQNKYLAEDSTAMQEWVLSGDFDKDIERFIAEDLESGLSKSPEKDESDPDLSHLVERILKADENKNAEQQIGIRRFEKDNQHHLSDSRKWTYPAAKVAASLLVIAVFAFIAYYFTKTPPQSPKVVEMITKENPRGRKSTVFLKDGSAVYLNSESSIRFPETFSDEERRIALNGEAYFEIAHNDTLPFIVEVGDIEVRVLGTSFNVNAFDETDRIKVSLNSGKVELRNMADSLRQSAQLALVPGKSISYSVSEKSFGDITEFDRELDLSWKDGKIVFKGADMETMFKRFERWYGVDFTFENEPYFKWNYDGTFHKQTLEDALELLSFSQSFDFEINNEHVNIVFKP